VIVLDASALIDVLLDQPSSEWVLAQLAGQDICAPAHQPAEVFSALARLHRAGLLGRDAMDNALAEASSLRQELVLPTLTHVRRAVQLSERIRVLDGLYVALAEARTAPLIATDRRLAGAGTSCEVRVPPR
jgi:predicted nucleic acid-binding protein